MRSCPGHFGWDVLALFPERPQVLTVLRDPVELILSLYGYWRAHAHEGIFSPRNPTGADEAASRPIDELLLDPNSQLRANLGMMMGYLGGRRGRCRRSRSSMPPCSISILRVGGNHADARSGCAGASSHVRAQADDGGTSSPRHAQAPPAN